MKQSLGAWEIHVNTEAMPEKIATAFDGLNQKWLGAKYRPIAYLGSQLVNGTNHAILGQQTMIDADNTKNVVLAVFNEPIFKGKIVEATLVYLEHILDTFSACGEIHVNDDFKITVEAQTAFDALIEKCTGVKVEPFAFLATQVTTDVNYFFAAVVTSLTNPTTQNVDLVMVSPNSYTITLDIII